MALVPSQVRGMRLSTRLGLALTGILVLAAMAQVLLYFRTRDETIEEANSSYLALAKSIELAATQMGPEGWKDTRLLKDFVEMLRTKGLRDIQVTEAGKPFPPSLPVTPEPGTKPRVGGSSRPKPTPAPHDILITGVVGEGTANRELVIPLVVEGRYLGDMKLSYEFENMRVQLAENFRRRLYALLGVFALGLAVLLILVRNATRPVDELADAVALVADGRLDVTVPVDRDDEIGRLAATFNRMTGKLREQKELEVRLLAAEKRAEIGHLASGLAHEIKNPLNALSLGLDVLRRRHRPPDETAAAEYGARIEALREEINRLTTLINNFLSFGRPLSITLAPTDLVSLVKSTLSDLAEIAEKAHVTIRPDLPERLPRIYSDAALIKSAVWNLVQNAVQAMERHGGTMDVSLVEETDGNRLTLTVKDSGPGIEAADLPRLFEPYFSKKEGGVGLGLAMVRRIVEDHGGRVTAENRPEGETGSIFRLSLPLPL